MLILFYLGLKLVLDRWNLINQFAKPLTTLVYLDAKSNFVAKAKSIVESIKTAFAMPALAPIIA